jgi:PST family polysaccharide transporter
MATQQGSTQGRSNSLVTGVLWNLAQFGAGRFVTFVVTIVLARLVEPSAFGLLALGLVALGVFDRLKDVGVGQGLVQRPGPWSRLAPTGFTLTVSGAIVLAGLCAVFAPQIAELLGDRALAPVLQVLAISLAVSGLAVFPDAALRRHMYFRQRTAPELAGAVAKGVVSIALALAGWGVWSLAWGQVAGSAATTIGYWIAYRRHSDEPIRPGWDRPVAKSLLTYGGQLAWVSLAALLLDNLDYILIGRRLGAEQLGYYTVAFRLPELLVISICTVIGQVLFSSFSARQDDGAGLRGQYLAATSVVAMVIVPIGAGLSATAPDVVPVVLGDAFSASVPVLQFLGIYGLVYGLTFHAGELYKATGRAHILLWLAVVKLVLMLPTLWIAAGHSITAVAGALVGLHVVFAVLRAGIVRRYVGISVGAQVRAVIAPVVAGAAMWGAVALVGALLPEWPHLVRLVLLMVVGAVVYLGALVVLDRSAIGQLRSLVGRVRGRA